MRILLLFVIAVFYLQCSNPPTPPKLGSIAVSVSSVGGITFPVSGIKVDLLQTGETKTTDSSGIAAFEVNPGTYTIRVHDLQGGGPFLHTVDSTIQVMAGQVDTLKYFDCFICV